jgi:hypothetical protein
MKRAMTTAERKSLERTLAEIGQGFWSQILPSLAFFAAITAALAYVVWSLLGWALRKTLDATWTEGLDPWVVAIVVAGTLAYFAAFALRGARRARALAPKLRRDLEDGVVDEKHFRFVEARRFQEPEHGGLVYFLLGADGKTLVLYDEESQELGVQGKDPLRSRFRVCAELALVKAPQAGITLDRRFSGAPLDVGAPGALNLPPQKWPEDESLCEVAWAELEQFLAAENGADGTREKGPDRIV